MNTRCRFGVRGGLFPGLMVVLMIRLPEDRPAPGKQGIDQKVKRR